MKVEDEQGQVVPSQRLATGELVFLASDVPPFAARRFTRTRLPPDEGDGQRHASRPVAEATGQRHRNELVTPPFEREALRSGRRAARSLSSRSSCPHRLPLSRTGEGSPSAELAGGAINSYIYLPGGNVKDAQPNGPAKISVKEAGPLVASLVVESAAPGCKRLVREVRVIDGLDRVEIIDTIDKLPVRAVEGVHFGFAFNVPNPEVRINSPGAVVRPEKDQLPGACKNWFSVERWVDVSNDDYGVTWVTADAPLMELGGLTANLPRSQPNPNAYMKTIEPSATLYSWVMNNHWHTNYRADQEGETTFRYYLRPHGAYDAVAAARFGIETTQPLIVVPARAPEAGRRRGCASNRPACWSAR